MEHPIRVLNLFKHSVANLWLRIVYDMGPDKNVIQLGFYQEIVNLKHAAIIFSNKSIMQINALGLPGVLIRRNFLNQSFCL